MAFRCDRTEIKAIKTDEGFIHDTPVITRTGVFSYRQPDGTVRKELRTPEHVFAEDSLRTLKGIPVTNGHPGKVTAKTPESNIGAVLSEGRQDGENLVAEISIHNTATVEAGNKELSCGYECDLVEESGTYNGERYDAIQTNIRHNHLAVVRKGRAGTARLNLDAADVAETNEEGRKMGKIRLDSGIEYEAAEEVVVAHEKLKQDNAENIAQLEAQKARADKAEADFKAAKNAQEKIKQDAVEQAKARIELEASAKQHGVEIKQDASDIDVKKAIIKKLNADADLSGKSDAYCDAMFDLLKQDAEAGAKNTAQQRKKMHNDAADKSQGLSSEQARQKMINGDTE